MTTEHVFKFYQHGSNRAVLHLADGTEITFERRRGRFAIIAPEGSELVTRASSGVSKDDLAEFGEMTNAELIAFLTSLGVDVPSRANKAQLLELIKGNF